MKCFVFLVMFCVCGVANAATMCVPDLSTCESCTGVKSIGQMFWSADCCGVPVSGVWMPVNGNNKRSVDIAELYLEHIIDGVGGSGYNFCVMLSPFIAPYAVNVKHYWVAGSDICSGFIPRCAVTYCDETVSEYSGGWL